MTEVNEIDYNYKKVMLQPASADDIDKQWILLKESLSRFPVVLLETKEDNLDVFTKKFYGDRNGTSIILYSFWHEETAKRIHSICKDIFLFEVGNIDKAIVGDTRHATNLGDQMASEIFANSMKFQNLDIFILGSDNIFISDRKGFNLRYTEHFWNSFISALNTASNNSRVIIFNKTGSTEVKDVLLSLSNAILSLEVVEGSPDFHIESL